MWIGELCCVLLLAHAGQVTRLPIDDSQAERSPAEPSPQTWLPPAEPAVRSLFADALDDDPLPLPSLRFTATCLPHLCADGFGVVTLDLHHTWLLGYDEIPPLNITPGGGMHLWTGPADLDLPPRVYDVYLDLAWRPLDLPRGGLALGVTPGLYGDFERVDGDAFQLTGWCMADFRCGENWTVMGGLAYVRQLRSNWLPVGGAVWTPNDATRLELLVPKPKLSRCLSRDGARSHWAYIAGQLGGGTWSVADTPDTNVLVNYSDLRLVAGWEGSSRHGREWRAELGYVFARDLSVNAAFLDAPADTFLAQAMLAF